MDCRLFEAAQTGNVGQLLELIEGDRLMLNAVALRGGETPLHIASMAGHLSFVKQILALRPEFAKELNQDGFSPLDLASANGHVEVVFELLKVDSNLCHVEGRERRIPLHYAAVKGRVDVMKYLLSSNADSVEKETVRGETALHLAVKNNQFEAFRLLVEHLKQFNKEHVLNKKDDKGNTILHLAVSRKQQEVVDLILNEASTNSRVVEVNSWNERGLTPLDVLLLFQSEAGDLEIQKILQQAGALRAVDPMFSSSTTPVQGNRNHQVPAASNEQPAAPAPPPAPRRYKSRAEELLVDTPNDIRNGLLVIAVLMATATYQAGLSPPGGVWQDDRLPTENSNNNITTPQSPSHNNMNSTNNNITTTSKWSLISGFHSGENNKSIYISSPHQAGVSIMGSKNRRSFIIFMCFNSLGFYMSLYIIIWITTGWPFWWELQIASFALFITYSTSMITIAPNNATLHLFRVISIVLPFIPVAFMFARKYMKSREDASWNSNKESA